MIPAGRSKVTITYLDDTPDKVIEVDSVEVKDGWLVLHEHADLDTYVNSATIKSFTVEPA